MPIRIRRDEGGMRELQKTVLSMGFVVVSILNLSFLKYSEEKRQHSLGRKGSFNCTASKLERSLAFRESSALEGSCNSRIV